RCPSNQDRSSRRDRRRRYRDRRCKSPGRCWWMRRGHLGGRSRDAELRRRLQRAKSLGKAWWSSRAHITALNRLRNEKRPALTLQTLVSTRRYNLLGRSTIPRDVRWFLALLVAIPTVASAKPKVA